MIFYQTFLYRKPFYGKVLQEGIARSQERVFHKRASCKRVYHRRVFCRRLSHGRVSHRKFSLRRLPHRRLGIDTVAGGRHPSSVRDVTREECISLESLPMPVPERCCLLR